MALLAIIVYMFWSGWVEFQPHLRIYDKHIFSSVAHIVLINHFVVGGGGGDMCQLSQVCNRENDRADCFRAGGGRGLEAHGWIDVRRGVERRDGWVFDWLHIILKHTACELISFLCPCKANPIHGCLKNNRATNRIGYMRYKTSVYWLSSLNLYSQGDNYSLRILMGSDILTPCCLQW